MIRTRRARKVSVCLTAISLHAALYLGLTGEWIRGLMWGLGIPAVVVGIMAAVWFVSRWVERGDA